MKWLPVVGIAGLAAVLIIGIVSLRGFQAGGGAAPGPQSIGGGSCEGLSTVGVPGPTTFNEIPVFEMDVTPNCPSGFLTGTFGSAWLREKSGGLLDYDSGFKITATASDESLIYPLVNDRITVNNLVLIGGGGDPGVVCSTTLGPNSYGYGYRAVGTKGHLEVMPNPVWHADLAFTLDTGETIVKRISSTDTYAEWTRNGDVVATASWSGYSLLAGQKPPDPTGVITVYGPDRGAWGLAWNSEWYAYQQADALSCTGAGGSSTAPLFNADTAGKIAKLNVAAAALMTSSATLPVAGAFAADGSGYVVTAAPRFQLPVIKIRVKGQIIGMEQAGGIPTLQFNGVKDPPYNAGNPGLLKFTLGNLGNNTAGFDLTGTCSGAPLFSPQRFSIGAKTSMPVEIPFTVSAVGNYQCEAALTDISTGGQARAAKAVVALAVQLCQPGQTSVITAYRVDRCKTDGSAWETVLDCSAVVVETYQASTCVAAANFGLVGVNETITATVAAARTPGPGECTYQYTQPESAGACSPGDRMEAAPTVGGVSFLQCTAIGRVAQKTYETRASAPVQFKDGKLTCAGAANSPQATVLSVTEKPAGTTATPLPAVTPGPAGPATPVAPAAGGAPRPTPGFEAVFALFGLVAVAYLVNRRKR